MKNKRIILDITEELHTALREYAVKDERSFNTTLRRVLIAGIKSLNITDDNNDSYSNSSNETTRSPIAELELKEIKEYGRILTDEERAYLAKNPSNKLREF